ncbi:MAG: signal peptidase II [Syntrophobacterales bacterium]|nr:signal peptidase II [Syntrophobacterales bacterium]
MNKKNGIFLTIALLVVLLDQATKAWIVSAMRLHDSYAVINGFFNITSVRNPGAAFGFLAGAPPFFRTVFFIAITIGAILLILYYLRVSLIDDYPLIISLALIFAGAAGNLIDRVRFGEVVDFLDFYLGNYHWPAFNVADSAITVGAFAMIIAMLRRRKGRNDAQ